MSDFDPNEEPPWNRPRFEGKERPTLDAPALAGVAGEIVELIEPHTEADPVGVLLSLLTMYGGAVGGGPHAQADGAHHPGRIFTCLVGDTAGGRKGTATAQARRVMAFADPDFIGTRVLGGFGSGEVLVDHVADPDEEGKGGTSDKRLLVLEPEFARLLKVATREGSTLSPIIREAWDGGRLAARSRQRTTVATGAHVTCLAHITETELRRSMTETESANGFANRFVFSFVRRSQRLPEGGNLDEAVVADYGRCLRDRLDRARRIGVLKRSDEARELWAVLYDRMADDEPGGLLGAVVARPEAQTLRLSVLYALMDASRTIEVDHLHAAWAMWSYCRQSAEMFFGDAQGDPIADRLLDAIRRAGIEGLDLTAQSKVFGRNVNAERLAAARRVLEDAGLIDTRPHPEPTGGRPRVISVALALHEQARKNEVTPHAEGLHSSSSFDSYDGSPFEVAS